MRRITKKPTLFGAGAGATANSGAAGRRGVHQVAGRVVKAGFAVCHPGRRGRIGIFRGGRRQSCGRLSGRLSKV
jgi:hypothetical protein